MYDLQITIRNEEQKPYNSNKFRFKKHENYYLIHNFHVIFWPDDFLHFSFPHSLGRRGKMVRGGKERRERGGHGVRAIERRKREVERDREKNVEIERKNMNQSEQAN